MKKLIIIISTVLIFMPNIKAYENNYFNVTIPESYVISTDEDKNYKWSYEEKDAIPNFSSVILENSGSKYNIESFTEKEITEYGESIEVKLNEGLKEYNITVEVTDTKKEKINGLYAITYVTHWPTKDSFGYDIYQKGYVFTTSKYITNISFTSKSKEDLDSEDNHSILNSFKINDKEITTSFINRKSLIKLSVSLVFAIIIGLVTRLITKKKKNN